MAQDLSYAIPDDNGYFEKESGRASALPDDLIENSAAEDLDRSHQALTLMLIFKENLETGMNIGGL